VQLWGLPYRVTEKEVADWLREVAEPVSVTILLEDSRPTGKADCVFSSARVAKRVAQTMHMKHMGQRYIECFYGVGEGAHKSKLSARSKSTQGQPPTPKPSIQGPDKVDTSSSSSMLQDCYFYQIEECEKKSKCPFLHRTIPEEVCKLFLFKLCKSIKCPKQHITPLSLPAPTEEEKARLRSVRKGKWKECLDCEVASTSYFLLENHLNSEEHWNKIKQIKIDGMEIKGVVGNKTDIWSAKDERHFIAAQKMKKAQNLSNDQIHIKYIPLDMTMKTFRQICLQFGELSSLKLLPMPEADAQHAYIRYTTEEDREFASDKLKELQKHDFAEISELLHERPGKDATIDDATIVKREEMFGDLLRQKISKISDKLQKLISAREEEETKLLFCRTKKKICLLNGADPEDTLELVEEELQIERDMRELECAVQQVEEELDNLKNCKTSGSKSFLNLKSERSPGNPCDFEMRKGEDLSIGAFFLPGDVFNSDDEDDVDVMKGEMSELKLGIKNMMLSLPRENSDDLIGQSKAVCEDDVIESSKPIVRNRNVSK